ncbi:MAG: TIGR03747 family integrating conjugative element membrane protein [Candidatus Sedimenticola endophacoides]
MSLFGRQASTPSDHAGRTASQEVPGILGALLRLLFWIALSLLASIIVEWIGMTWWWSDEGTGHSQMILETEIGYLSGDLRRSAFVQDTAAYARHVADTGYEWIWVQSGLVSAFQWMAVRPSHDASAFRQMLYRAHLGVAEYVTAAATITQVFFVRLAVLSLSMPAFVLALLVGFLDGAVQRDLRKWGGGRESSFVYHHARRWIVPIFILVWVLYLSLPFSVHPAIAVLPFAAVLGLLMAITVSSFKKYL